MRAPGLRRGQGKGEGAVESNHVASIGFLKDPERLNVAITRAKYALWMIGHAETLSKGDSEWNCLVKFAIENRLVKNNLSFYFN